MSVLRPPFPVAFLALRQDTGEFPGPTLFGPPPRLFQHFDATDTECRRATRASGKLLNMGLGMGLRIAPGVKIRASGSGIRSSVGPRPARVHVGGGRTAISTGFGPFTASATSKGRSRPPAKQTRPSTSRKSSSSSDLDGLAAGLGLALGVIMLLGNAGSRVEAKKLAADSARAAELLTSVHLEDFPVSTKPVATSASRRLRKFGRRDPIEEAHLVADHEHDLACWKALHDHEPEEVIATVDGALADNASWSACIDAGRSGFGNYVTLVVHYPGPEIAHGVVKVGSGTRARTEDEISDIYRRALASTVIATAKEALAYAPAADEAYVVVLRYDARGVFTKRTAVLDAIYAGAFDRDVLNADWESNDPYKWMMDARAVRVNVDRRGRFKSLGERAGEDLQRLVAEVAAVSREDLRKRFARRKSSPAESRDEMRTQEQTEFQAICDCPGCGEIAAHALRGPTVADPTWAKTIRVCANCGREWAQC